MSPRFPHQIRRYAADPRDRPIPARVADTDPAGLAILATEDIGGRTVRFAVIPGQTRLRVSFADVEPAVLGSVIGLDADKQYLKVSESAHMEWASAFDHTRLVKRVAYSAWHAAQRQCEG